MKILNRWICIYEVGEKMECSIKIYSLCILQFSVFHMKMEKR
jgi:hypothetical protein